MDAMRFTGVIALQVWKRACTQDGHSRCPRTLSHVEAQQDLPPFMYDNTQA